MDIGLISPVPRNSNKGNRMTTDRWERVLSELGHDVTVSTDYDGTAFDMLIVLHARRGHEALKSFNEQYPGRPLILALTGTDVYRDIHENDQARESLRLADRYVVLQPLAAKELPPELQSRAHVVYQSVPEPESDPSSRKDQFEVAVIGHLRSVKDPFRTAEALYDLPADSSIVVTHLGEELEEGMAETAREHEANLDRYTWLGGVAREEALTILQRSKLMVISSRMEGGAHVVSEAIVCDTPVIASDIPGNRGLLGENYPGYFPVEDTEALRSQLRKAETDSDFYRTLQSRIQTRRANFHPDHEREQWRELLEEINQPSRK